MNLTGANFSGRDLSGQDWSGKDFSHANIRGTNFTNAILVGTNFSHAQAGLTVAWKIGLIVIAIAISLFGGLIAGHSATFISNILIGNSDSFLFSIIALISLAFLLAIVVLRGLSGLLAISVEVVAACSIATIAFMPTSKVEIANQVQLVALAIAGNLSGAVNMAIGIAIARLVSIWHPKFPTIFVGTFGIVYGIGLGSRDNIESWISFQIALTSIMTGAWAGWLAISSNKKYQLIYFIATGLVAKGGTNFHGANLTDADFTNAKLKSTDFRSAKLTRTNWFQAQHLEQGQLEGTYLADARVRQLVVTKDGQAENFDLCDLRGLNLQNANLTDASFIGANLSEANLQNANLSRAKLVQTQLYQTDLHGACLTGAYIQDWAISIDTIFEAVRCDYTYMRLPTIDDPEPWRKPDNRQEIFQAGDFAEFIAPIIKTLNLYNQQNLDPRQIANSLKSLDLYHYQGIDPSAAAIALTEVAEHYPEAGLEVVALEGRGNEKIRLQAVVTGKTDSSQLSAEYFERYRTISALPSKDIKALLATAVEKDERIRSLEQMVMSAIEGKKFYFETNYQLGDKVSEKSSINITSGSGDISNISGLVGGDVSGVVNLGEISGNVTNAINQLPDSAGTNEQSLKELLLQLQAAIEAEPALTPEDKVEALAEVKVLAEAGQAKADNVLQKAAKRSITFLKGTISSLPDAAKLASACATLLPLISKLLGF